MIKYDPYEYRGFLFRLRFEMHGIEFSSKGMREIIIFGETQNQKYIEGGKKKAPIINPESGLIQYVGIPIQNPYHSENYVIKRENMNVKDIMYITNKIKKIKISFNDLIAGPRPWIDGQRFKFEIEFNKAKVEFNDYDNYNIINLEEINMIQKKMIKLMPEPTKLIRTSIFD